MSYDEVDDAVPSKYFAHPPYRAEQFRSDIDTAGVMNANGINCLTFKSRPGSVLAGFETYKKIAEKWNRKPI